jgi:hypothetical protein
MLAAQACGPSAIVYSVPPVLPKESAYPSECINDDYEQTRFLGGDQKSQSAGQSRKQSRALHGKGETSREIS